MERPATVADIGSMETYALYKAKTKGPGTPGVLRMNEDKLSFVPDDPRSTMTLDVSFRRIKCQKHNIVDASKPSPPPALLKLFEDMGGCYTFEFDNVVKREECRDFVARVLDRHEEATLLIPNASPENMVTSTGPEPLSPEEVERRMNLLLQDSELIKLHKHFVLGNILEESEFWVTRKHLLHCEVNETSKQRPGFKNSMPDVGPLAHDQTDMDVPTTEIVHQIFLGKPSVCRLFLESVPKKMSEKVFWSKYCRADCLLRTKNIVAAEAEAAEDEELSVFLTNDDILAKEAKLKIEQIDPTVDLVADAGDDYIHFLDNETDCKLAWRTLSQDLNQHAAVVLEGRSSDKEFMDTKTIAEVLARSRKESHCSTTDDHKRFAKVSRMTEIEDLQIPQNLKYAPLLIKAPQQYFYSNEESALRSLHDSNDANKAQNCSLSTDDVFHHLIDQISSVELNKLNCCVVHSDVAVQVLNKMNQVISLSRCNLRDPHENLPGQLPHQTVDELMDNWIVIRELLQHFWSAYLTSSAAHKAQRIKEAMAQMYKKLQDIKESAQPNLRHQISLLVKPMTQALDAAFEHDQELQQGSSYAVKKRKYPAGSEPVTSSGLARR